MPIVNTARALRRLPQGSLVEVLTTDPGSVEDFSAWSLMTGNQVLERAPSAGVYRFVVRKG
jgi:tRNA 2-thiouridine synthesizing protein A